MEVNTPTSDDLLWAKLKTADLVQGEMPVIEIQNTPWYIKTMQGFAGWVAAFFMLAFFASVFEWLFNRESSFALIAIGLIGNIIAYSIFRVSKKNEFLHQLALVFNLCGQLMVGLGIFESIHSFSASYFFILFSYQLSLVIIIPDFSSRVLTTSFALFSLFLGFSRIGIFNIATAIVSVTFVLIWMNDLRWQKMKKLWEAIGYGLSISLMQFNSMLLFSGEFSWWKQSSSIDWLNQYSYWLSKIIIAVIFISLLIKLAKQYQITLPSKTGLLTIISGILLLCLGYFITGTSGALLLLLIGFIKQRKLLISFGVIALLGFISWYYYHLGLTLMDKSLTLAVFGTCFLIVFYFLHRLNNGNKILINHLKHKYKMNLLKWISALSMVFILLFTNINIYKKENILKHGEIVLLKLAPVDPRSLMQGDFMNLRFEIENFPLKNIDSLNSDSKKYFILNLNEHNIGQLIDNPFTNEDTLNNSQIKIKLRVYNHRARLPTHAFFFQEGTGEKYEKARYGEFRVDNDGNLLLNNLRDESLNILGYNLPTN